uniref:Secreted protein n=1 Tax=Rhipicephalus appendiculatus TaxID=34631 RepID=A0A131YCR9_RHIAP
MLRQPLWFHLTRLPRLSLAHLSSTICHCHRRTPTNRVFLLLQYHPVRKHLAYHNLRQEQVQPRQLVGTSLLPSFATTDVHGGPEAKSRSYYSDLLINPNDR